MDGIGCDNSPGPADEPLSRDVTLPGAEDRAIPAEMTRIGDEGRWHGNGLVESTCSCR